MRLLARLRLRPLCWAFAVGITLVAGPRSASAQARWVYVESTDTVSSSTSSRASSGNPSRIAHSSLEHTPLNASG